MKILIIPFHKSKLKLMPCCGCILCFQKSLYNLGDNEELTHRGESLADIEKFDDPKSDDDDDDQEDGRRRSGKLEQDFVSEAHFGGGMLKKVDGENKSRKDLIDQMIADSKKRKAEQQKLREQTLDLTEKLDTAWKDILPLVATPKNSRPDDNITLKSDRRFASYDILSKELIFEARGKVRVLLFVLILALFIQKMLLLSNFCFSGYR